MVWTIRSRALWQIFFFNQLGRTILEGIFREKLLASLLAYVWRYSGLGMLVWTTLSLFSLGLSAWRAFCFRVRIHSVTL